MDQKKPHVVFIPLPAQSHIKCMLKLATLLHHHGLQITFINTHSNHTRLLASAAAHRLRGAPGFQFRSVPDGLPSANSDIGGQEPTETLWQVMTGYLTANFLDSFLEVVAGVETPATCIISDGFMTFARTPLAAEKLGVPIILFWTMAASGFMGYYQAKVLMERGIVPIEEMDEKKTHVVFIPYPAQSHIKCMLKLATLLHHHGLHITFINTHSNHTRLLGSAAAHRLHGAPGFQFRSVPDGLPNSTNPDGQEPSQTLYQVAGYLTTHFLDSFLEVVAGVETPATCIISDGFMTFARTPLAAEKLGVPIILFWTMAACGFMGFYQAKVLFDRGIVPLEDESHLTNGYLDTMVDIAGMKEIRLKDLPEHVLGIHPRKSVFSFVVETAKEADKHSHVIIHTFDVLESGLIEELKSMFPNVYTVGPLQLLLNQIIPETEPKNSNLNGYSLWTEEPECIKWLESKEPNSVVYVNFGSLAVMCLQDLLEFGWGLVNSGHFFLWIIRSDLVDGKPAVFPAELEEVVNERGFIASWCSQEEVLSHRAVGGFLTHGGWGSVIESLSSGVPMVCWPFTGDQRMNCRQMCKDWEVGMEIGRSVKREEVEKVVRALMAGDEGRRMRTKAIKWKKMAETAAGPDGSSVQSVRKLVHEINMVSIYEEKQQNEIFFKENEILAKE
ncbi:hypothetical protein OSB04_007693 [Centaurea solstitialis]|uniref:Glycosyltransferase n=1 Tax=Centaurea solstitialis TaxID=347529 RepID=A0AA38TSX1_9ASTR|nr:hypothetical protein OSB04_007693 [Centaurea solstitialis]